MKPYFEQDGITIYHGDSAELMLELPSFDLVEAEQNLSSLVLMRRLVVGQ